MSAAPLVSSLFFESACSFSNPVKRLRRSEEDGGQGIAFEASVVSNSCTFQQNMEDLRKLFPSINEGILSSILESAGDKLNVATSLLSQIVTMRNSNRLPRVAKRRRSPSFDVLDEAIPVCPEAAKLERETSRPEQRKVSYVETAASQILLRIRDVSTESEAFHRLQPIIQDILQNDPELQHVKSMQKLLTKAILRQADRIQNLTESSTRATGEVQEWKEKALALQSHNLELQGLNRRLRDANNILSYYIKSTAKGDHCGNDTFENNFHGPDVC